MVMCDSLVGYVRLRWNVIQIPIIKDLNVQKDFQILNPRKSLIIRETGTNSMSDDASHTNSFAETDGS
jgi:hypothetical protein